MRRAGFIGRLSGVGRRFFGFVGILVVILLQQLLFLGESEGSGLRSERGERVALAQVEPFDAFVARAEPKLTQAFVARFGRTDGVEAASEALAYAWEHWNRVSVMVNPIGYLYRVGHSRTRRIRRRTPTLPAVEPSGMPEVDPGLPAALAALSPRQRVVVILVHGLGWHQRDAAELLGVSRSTVQNHLDRGLAQLRERLERTR